MLLNNWSAENDVTNMVDAVIVRYP